MSILKRNSQFNGKALEYVRAYYEPTRVDYVEPLIELVIESNEADEFFETIQGELLSQFGPKIKMTVSKFRSRFPSGGFENNRSIRCVLPDGQVLRIEIKTFYHELYSARSAAKKILNVSFEED
jgi:hypothetical protein